MIYLTNDALDQAVYFEPRCKDPMANRSLYGLVGNGVHEVPVLIKRGCGSLDITFGRGSELFAFVAEETLRRMLREAVAAPQMH